MLNKKHRIQDFTYNVTLITLEYMYQTQSAKLSQEEIDDRSLLSFV